MSVLDTKALNNAITLLDAIGATYIVEFKGRSYENKPHKSAAIAPKKAKRVSREHLYLSYITDLPVAGKVIIPAQDEVTPFHLQSVVSGRLSALYGAKTCGTTLLPDGSVEVMRMR